MKLNSKLVRLLALTVFGLTVSTLAWANGEEFFSPGDLSNAVFYFGHVKDTNGKVLNDVQVNVNVKGSTSYGYSIGMDTPGHFRTAPIPLDIAKTAQVSITVSKNGYRQVSPSNPVVTRRGPGHAILVDFVMAPVSQK